MDMYVMMPWFEYKNSLGFYDNDSFLESQEFSSFLKSKFEYFENEPWNLSVEELETILIELKNRVKMNPDVFKELEIFINVSKPPVEPFARFSNPDFIIYKRTDEWKLYHKTGFFVSKVFLRGEGNHPDSLKLAYITDSAYKGQGLTSELVKMFIENQVGLLEIKPINEASIKIAIKNGFELSSQTNTYLLKK